jgi:hypothetical protein
MKQITLIILSLLIGKNIIAQISTKSGIFFAKEYSKEISLYNAKEYVMNQVLGQSSTVVKFEISTLAASSSGELTSLVYKCDDLNKEGLILGFYGDTRNELGVTDEAYAFKNIPSDTAIDLLNKLDSVTSVYEKYTSANKGTNNIYFHYDDITFLIYGTQNGALLRVFWNGFDSEWEWDEVAKTKKRLLKKLDL